jgi:hypothetical protein
MSAVSLFVVGMATTIAVVTFSLWYLKTPLQIILTDLCGTAERARFWTVFSNVTLFLVPFAVALDHHPLATSWPSSFFEICAQVEWAVFGFVGSVLALGLILGRSIPQTKPIQSTTQSGRS